MPAMMNLNPMEDTLVLLKPDTFWRGLAGEVETRLQKLGRAVISDRKLAGPENLPEERWREFYFPAIVHRPACLAGISKFQHGSRFGFAGEFRA